MRQPLLCLVLLVISTSPPAGAVDAFVLEVGELRVAGIPVESASVRLDLLTDRETRLTLRVRTATLPEPAGKLQDLTFVCTSPVIAEPRFGCDAGRFTGRGGPTGSFDVAMTVGMRTDTGITTFGGRGLKVAGTTATFDGRVDDKGWQVKGGTGTTTVEALRKFAAPWFELPADITGDGKVAIEGAAADSGSGTVVDATMNLDATTLTNEASTIVTDNLAAMIRLRARLNAADTAFELEVTGKQGQILVNPVLLDLGKNPLVLESRANLKGDLLAIESLRLTQKDLIELTGTGSVNLATEVPGITGNFQLAKFQFPAAYTSYMQITLATTSVLSNLDTSGSLSGEVAVRDNGITALRLSPRELGLRDKKDRLHLTKVNGEVHWTPAGVPNAPLSKLSWSEGGAYGLSGGAAALEFLAQGAGFRLTRPTKLPVFDGAIAIDTLALGNLDGDNMEVAFKGAVEPISMPLLAKAFGWPEFSGTLAASVPGVTLKDKLLTFQGNVESQVFGGRIVGSNIRLQDPLGRFPQFFADVRARDLDLAL
ncbi:MAG TPA: hypothetical protein VFS58_03565, partial [Steroidobacteraceae bacterium]|nr:hypothetical protein [Steroidobacteraceae bacterium]